MPVSLSSAITAALMTLDDENSYYYTSAELTQWINDACSDISKRAEVLQGIDTILTTPNQQQYTCPPQMTRIAKAQWQQTSPGQPSAVANPTSNIGFTYTLEYRGISELDSVWGNNHSIPSAYPRFYTLLQQPPALQLILYPVPSVNGTLTLIYYRIATPVVNTTDLLDIPEGWEPCVREYVCYMAYRKARSPEYQVAKQAYEDELTEMINKTRRFADAQSQIYNGTSNVPGWLYGSDI